MDRGAHQRLARKLPTLGRTIRPLARDLWRVLSYRLLHDRLTKGCAIGSRIFLALCHQFSVWTAIMTSHIIETSIKGKWNKAVALAVNGTDVIVRGRWIKVAAIHNEQWLDIQIEDPEQWVEKLKENRLQDLRADIFTFSQKPPFTLPKFQYPMEWESLAAISISTFDDWWTKLPQEGRKNVRRSEKRGVVVKVKGLDDDLVRDIIAVNNDSPLRQGRTFDHFGKTFDQVKKDQMSFMGQCDFICAYLGEELIGFLKLVYIGKIASILQFLPKASHYDKRPANAMVAKAVELCETKRISYLVYGLFNYGNKQDSSLKDFKIRNGFKEILVPRFYVPLTTWGKVCLRLKLHRGLIGILPPSAITIGLSLRAKWYNLQRFVGRCSSMLERPNRTRQMERSNPPTGSRP